MTEFQDKSYGTRVQFLPANQAWVWTFGGVPQSLDGTMFFQSRAELVAILDSKGIEVDSFGVTSVKAD